MTAKRRRHYPKRLELAVIRAVNAALATPHHPLDDHLDTGAIAAAKDLARTLDELEAQLGLDGTPITAEQAGRRAYVHAQLRGALGALLLDPRSRAEYGVLAPTDERDPLYELHKLPIGGGADQLPAVAGTSSAR